MKNISLYILVLFNFVFIKPAQPITSSAIESSAINKIIDDFKKYRLSSPWVTRQLINLKVDEFFIVWHELVARLTDKNNPYLYFDEKKPYFRIKEYWEKVIWQCNNYDIFIESLFVNTITQEIWYVPTQVTNSEEVPITEYWRQSTSSDWTDLSTVYAFYADAFSHLLNKAVRGAYDAINGPEYYDHYITVHFIIDLYESLLPKLKESVYLPRYMIDAKRYKEIRTLLEKEHAQIVKG